MNLTDDTLITLKDACEIFFGGKITVATLKAEHRGFVTTLQFRLYRQVTRMTKAQHRLVQKIKDGCVLIRSFDVYGGYWWWLRPTNEKVLRSTVEALVREKVLAEGKNERVYSGYQEMPYILADR